MYQLEHSPLLGPFPNEKVNTQQGEGLYRWLQEKKYRIKKNKNKNWSQQLPPERRLGTGSLRKIDTSQLSSLLA